LYKTHTYVIILYSPLNPTSQYTYRILEVHGTKSNGVKI